MIYPQNIDVKYFEDKSTIDLFKNIFFYQALPSQNKPSEIDFTTQNMQNAHAKNGNGEQPREAQRLRTG